MSRIGKKLIEIPQGVKVEITDKEIKVSGPKGELKQAIHPEIKIETGPKGYPALSFQKKAEGCGAYTERLFLTWLRE